MPGREELVRVEFVAARENCAEIDGDPFAIELGEEDCV